MGKQAKPKQDSVRADNRANGKVPKKNPGRRVTGSKHVVLSDTQKILMGKGLYVKYARMNNEGARLLQGKKNKSVD